MDYWCKWTTQIENPNAFLTRSVDLQICIFHPLRSNAEIEASLSSKSATGANTFLTTHHDGDDIEIANSSNRFNGSSSEGSNRNGQRLSQRITNFIENKGRFGASNNTNASFNESSLYGSGSKEAIAQSNNGNFMRPMSPVNVDYPNDRMFSPTQHFSSGLSPSTSPTTDKRNMLSNRNVSVDDPYTNRPVNFTMVEPTNMRYNSPGKNSFEGSFRSASPEQAINRGQDYPM